MNYLIAANWKMNCSRDFIGSYLSALDIKDNSDVKMLICPPDCYLGDFNSNALKIISRGAQNLSTESEGAYTGEVSNQMLIDHNVEYVIVGHSERRQYHNETNEIVAKKFKRAIDSNIIPILCVGESLEQRQSGETFNHIREQVVSVIGDDMVNNSDRYVIAYEPIWAMELEKQQHPIWLMKFTCLFIKHLMTMAYLKTIMSLLFTEEVLIVIMPLIFLR